LVPRVNWWPPFYSLHGRVREDSTQRLPDCHASEVRLDGFIVLQLKRAAHILYSLPSARTREFKRAFDSVPSARHRCSLAQVATVRADPS
jgi:hypothetical protein